MDGLSDRPDTNVCGVPILAKHGDSVTPSIKRSAQRTYVFGFRHDAQFAADVEALNTQTLDLIHGEPH